MVDEELSRAVIGYLLGGGPVSPRENMEGVIASLGTETAGRLEPRLRQLARDAVYWPVDWEHNDDVSAMRVVERGMAAEHPELSAEAVRALSLYFSFCNR